MFFKHSHLKQKSYIANASSTLRHQQKNRTPTTGRLIFVAETKYSLAPQVAGLWGIPDGLTA